MTRTLTEYGKRGKYAAQATALLTSELKNKILQAMAAALLVHTEVILSANAQDLTQAAEYHLSPALTERLTLSPEKIQAMAQGIQEACALPDPIGEVISNFDSPDGLNISKVRVPIGLLLMIYESRPNVTADAAVLAIKSGNAIILKGGKEALNTNRSIANILIAAGTAVGLPADAVQFIDSSDREITNDLMTDTDHVDAIIPRGGPALKKAITSVAKVPVLMTGAGVCHLYLHAAADPSMAKAIALNAKTQRPGVCNAIETLLIDEAFPQTFSVLEALMAAGVHLKVCEKTHQCIERQLMCSPVSEVTKAKYDTLFSPATEADYAEEYLGLTLAVKQVNSVDEAIAHIRQYSTGHSESIITEDLAAAEHFLNAVDSACVYHNASTRFTDGGCFGFGCEIGIATQKLHARGPMGLRELTSYKYQIRGKGQVRT